MNVITTVKIQLFVFMYLNHLKQTKTVEFQRLISYWWRMWDSNPRPPTCKAGALAN